MNLMLQFVPGFLLQHNQAHSLADALTSFCFDLVS